MTGEMDYEILKLAGLIDDRTKLTNSKIITGGLNSGIRLVEVGCSKYIIKTYPKDLTRQRLDTEFRFLVLMNKAGIPNVPKPIKKLSSLNVGVYSYLHGKTIETATDFNVLASADFIIELNEKLVSFSKEITLGSDHFVSYENLLESIERRILSLMGWAHRHSREYIQTVNEFYIIFQKITDQNSTTAKEFNDNICKMKQVISPSDFGLHNMLQNKKTIKFLDFEYAGNDSCLKLICDFYCQPRIPVSNSQFKGFVGKLNNSILHMNSLFEVSAKFLPLFRLKWSCIILNQVNKVRDNKPVNRTLNNSQIEKSRAYLHQNLGN
jgi:hypothetical protein